MNKNEHSSSSSQFISCKFESIKTPPVSSASDVLRHLTLVLKISRRRHSKCPSAIREHHGQPNPRRIWHALWSSLQQRSLLDAKVLPTTFLELRIPGAHQEVQEAAGLVEQGCLGANSIDFDRSHERHDLRCQFWFLGQTKLSLLVPWYHWLHALSKIWRWPHRCPWFERSGERCDRHWFPAVADFLSRWKDSSGWRS